MGTKTADRSTASKALVLALFFWCGHVAWGGGDEGEVREIYIEAAELEGEMIPKAGARGVAAVLQETPIGASGIPDHPSVEALLKLANERLKAHDTGLVIRVILPEERRDEFLAAVRSDVATLGDGRLAWSELGVPELGKLPVLDFLVSLPHELQDGIGSTTAGIVFFGPDVTFDHDPRDLRWHAEPVSPPGTAPDAPADDG